MGLLPEAASTEMSATCFNFNGTITRYGMPAKKLDLRQNTGILQGNKHNAMARYRYRYDL